MVFGVRFSLWELQLGLGCMRPVRVLGSAIALGFIGLPISIYFGLI